MNSFTQIYDNTMSIAQRQLSDFKWVDHEHYALWLSQSFYFVRHSTRLLALAAARADIHDSLTHSRFLSHLKEETGHENLILQDLKAMGAQIENFPEFISTQLFYSQQYYVLDSYGPGAFMGWIILLEGIASVCGPSVLEKASQHPANMTRFLRTHSEEDQAHIQSAFELIEKTGVSSDSRFQNNFKVSTDLYLGIFSEITELCCGPKNSVTDIAEIETAV